MYLDEMKEHELKCIFFLIFDVYYVSVEVRPEAIIFVYASVMNRDINLSFFTSPRYVLVMNPQ